MYIVAARCQAVTWSNYGLFLTGRSWLKLFNKTKCKAFCIQENEVENAAYKNVALLYQSQYVEFQQMKGILVINVLVTILLHFGLNKWTWFKKIYMIFSI